MAYPKFKPIVDEVITLMGQVAGSAVQTYSEPLVKIAINRIFSYLSNKRKWDHLWGWQNGTIGVDGKLTSNITGIQTYLDVAIIRDKQTKRIITMPVEAEHLDVTGSTPTYRTILPWNDPAAETRYFQFWPIGTTGAVEIFCGFRPDEFSGDDDVVPMPRDLIVLGAVWFMLADDGTNPASADKYQGLFDISYQDIISRNNAQPIGHGSGMYDGRTVRIQ